MGGYILGQEHFVPKVDVFEAGEIVKRKTLQKQNYKSHISSLSGGLTGLWLLIPWCPTAGSEKSEVTFREWLFQVYFQVLLNLYQEEKKKKKSTKTCAIRSLEQAVLLQAVERIEYLTKHSKHEAAALSWEPEIQT